MPNAPNAGPIAQSTPVESQMPPGPISAMPNLTTSDIEPHAPDAPDAPDAPGAPGASSAEDHHLFPEVAVEDIDFDGGINVAEAMAQAPMEHGDQAMTLGEFGRRFLQQVDQDPIMQLNAERAEQVIQRAIERRSVCILLYTFEMILYLHMILIAKL